MTNNTKTKILLVDDNLDEIIALQNSIKERTDIELITTQKPEEAKELILKENIPIIISDQNMPSMSGIELLTQIKELVPDSIRIIFSVCDDSNTILEAINRVGIYQYLIKPWTKANLFTLLDSAIEKYHYQLERKSFIKQLEKINSELENKILTIISHDLNSPLSSIDGLLNLIINNYQFLTYEDVLDLGQKLQTSIANTNDMLKNLIDWSYRKTELKPDLNTFNIQEIVNQVISDVLAYSLHKNITIINRSIDFIITTDKDILNIILRNIMTNAIKFSYEGQEVVIRTKVEEEQAKITIIDNGVGMNELDIARIKDLKQHFSTYGTSNEKGAGLGLTVSQEFIELLNGELKIYSYPGKGSTFEICLPIN